MRQLIIAIVIALLAVVFALQNSDLVSVKFFAWELGNTSMALVLLITLILGLVTGMLFLAPGIYKRNTTIGAQKKRIGELERELALKKAEQKPL